MIDLNTFDYIKDYLESYSAKSLRERIPGHFGITNTPDQEDIDHIMDCVGEKILELRLIEEHGYWAIHPDFPIEDWRYSVRDDDTRTGYWQWVAKQIQPEGD